MTRSPAPTVVTALVVTQPGAPAIDAEPGRDGVVLLPTNPNQTNPTPRSPRPPTPRLDTARKVRRELARLYNEARRGELDTAEAARLAHILAVLAKAIEIEDVEKRLRALEQSTPRKRR